MYKWRKMSESERAEVLALRKEQRRPWHGPPHRAGWQTDIYHITAACYEHAPVIGSTDARMDAFTDFMLKAFHESGVTLHAWCVLPNHYHALVSTLYLKGCIHALGHLHGSTSRVWNVEDKTPGRHVWHRAADRAMRGESHFWATLNYIHHNPVHHGYVKKWADWPWSSAHGYLAEMDRTEAMHIWKKYPLKNYGRGWDDPSL